MELQWGWFGCLNLPSKRRVVYVCREHGLGEVRIDAFRFIKSDVQRRDPEASGEKMT